MNGADISIWTWRPQKYLVAPVIFPKEKMKNNCMTLTHFLRITFITALGGQHCHHSHLREEETEAHQGGLVTCPRPRS